MTLLSTRAQPDVVRASIPGEPEDDIDLGEMTYVPLEPGHRTGPGCPYRRTRSWDQVNITEVYRR